MGASFQSKYPKSAIGVLSTLYTYCEESDNQITEKTTFDSLFSNFTSTKLEFLLIGMHFNFESFSDFLGKALKVFIYDFISVILSLINAVWRYIRIVLIILLNFNFSVTSSNFILQRMLYMSSFLILWQSRRLSQNLRVYRELKEPSYIELIAFYFLLTWYVENVLYLLNVILLYICLKIYSRTQRIGISKYANFKYIPDLSKNNV